MYGPDVGAHVVQHPVEACDVGVELGLPVVALDLGRQGVPREPEVLDEVAAHLLPVHVREGDHVGAVGAGGPVELPEELGVLDPRAAVAGGATRGRPAPCPSSSASPAGHGCGRAAGPPAGRDAIVASRSTRPVARGSHTSCTAPLTIRAYERLLTSSLVQQKCTSSASPASSGAGAMSREALLEEVLDGLDVVLGDPLLDGQLLDLGARRSSGRPRAAPPAPAR